MVSPQFDSGACTIDTNVSTNNEEEFIMNAIATAQRLVGANTTYEYQVSDKILKVLNDVWKAIRKNNPDVPETFIVLQQSGSNGRGSTTFGHYMYGGWNVSKKNISEVMISGECMSLGAEGILETLIHEAVHGVAHVRELKDTSRQNRYHNKVFKALAEELTLAWAKDEEGKDHKPCTRRGYSAVQVTPETLEVYSEELKALEALPLETGRVKGTHIHKGVARVPVTCECGHETSFGHVTWRTIAPLICGTCMGQYRRIPRDGEEVVEEGVEFVYQGLDRFQKAEDIFQGRRFGFWWFRDQYGDLQEHLDFPEDCINGNGYFYPQEWEQNNNGIFDN